MTTTTSTRTFSRRWAVLLLAVLAAVLALVLPASTASANGLSAAQTRVGVSTLAAPDVVGVAEHIAAGQRRSRAPSQLRLVSGHCVAAEDGSVAAARAARDAKAAEVGSSKATVTGGYGKDGVPRAGCNSNPIGCAEDDVARQIGGDPGDINFTEAIRPRTGEQVPICWSCQGKYDPSQFPPGTEWKPGGPWDNR